MLKFSANIKDISIVIKVHIKPTCNHDNDCW